MYNRYDHYKTVVEGGITYTVETDVKNGAHHWWLNGKLHRELGPAADFPSTGAKFWFFRGEKINVTSQEEYTQWLKLKVFE